MARRRQRKGIRSRSVSEAPPLPALSLLMDVPGFDELACDEDQARAFEAALRRLEGEGVPAAELELACVVRLDRGFPALACARGVVRAEFAAQLTKGERSRVAVGDWVCLRLPEGHDMGLIQEVLPRRGELARWRGGSRGERQTLAANVDLVLVVVALGEASPSANRLARSVVVARDCGADAAIVLTKADRVSPESLRAAIRAVREVLGGVDVACSCAQAADDALKERLGLAARAEGALWGERGVRELVRPGRVAIMLGESGAGKSTLLNALLGHEALETGSVRERDDQGRHTTVARRMVSIPGAGIVVDAPGLRSLPIVGHERGLALAFGELSEAAEQCRFRDCTHTHEPGCAVLSLVAAGDASQPRYDAFVALAREMRESATSLDPDVSR